MARQLDDVPGSTPIGLVPHGRADHPLGPLRRRVGTPSSSFAEPTCVCPPSIGGLVILFLVLLLLLVAVGGGFIVSKLLFLLLVVAAVLLLMDVLNRRSV